MKRLLAILLLMSPPVFAQEVQSVYSGNLVNPTGTPTDTSTTFLGYGTLNEPITCMAPGQPGYCGPLAAVNGFGADTGLINFSYGQSNIYQDFDLRKVLPNGGDDWIITQYDFTFLAKNGNGWDNGALDGLSAYVNLYNDNKLIASYYYDLNYVFSWTQFSYSKQFDEVYTIQDLDTIRIGFIGQDYNFFAGFYGPEVTNIGFGVYYEVDPCVDDPLSRPTCPGYIEALLALVDIDEEPTLIDQYASSEFDGGTLLVADSEMPSQDDELITDEAVSEDEALVESDTDTQIALAESTATYRELSDEEKAQILADSISKSTIEAALSIADTAAAPAAMVASDVSVTSTATRSTNARSEAEQDSEDKNSVPDMQQVDNGTDAAMETLETGRTLNASSLQSTQQQSEQSASDSVNQAETIAENSSMVNSVDSLREDAVAALATEPESVSIMESTTIEMPVSDTQDLDLAVPMMSAAESETVDVVLDQTPTESVIVEESTLMAGSESMADTASETMDSFADIMMIEIGVKEASADDLEFVTNLQATLEQQQQDNSESALTQEEQITIQNDPALANAFNLMPNVNNLESLGVLSNRAEDKSDAEKRAEQVTAANKEQQDEINKNYMDADQSGIVAAMGADVDVASYRSAMLNDNTTWYRPEDIYKNVVYRDNVRGAYYLEKGNSDTYRRMVDEQYK